MNKNILCIGAGYVGGPTMAMIAERCPDYKVTVVDINPERIAAWHSEHLPICEPGLDKLGKRNRGLKLEQGCFLLRNIPLSQSRP